MKLILFLAAAAMLATSSPAADAPLFCKKGDVLSLQTVSPLQDGAPKQVTVVEAGAGGWVLVEYDRTFSTPGESGMKTEKAQMWVNFAHVISAKIVPAKK